MRTFSRDQWEDAQAQWLDFSDDWKPFRHEAAMRGMLFPPDGTRFDSWDDDEPSQRAQLIRAIRETPKLLHQAIARSRTWFEVIAYVNARRDERRLEVDRDDWETARHRASDVGPVESAMALKAIVQRIADS